MEFEAWILNNSKLLNLKVTELTWIKQFFDNCFEFRVRLTLNNEETSGFGHADNKDLALTKAIVEALERHIVFFNKLKSSNGVAAHFDEKIAIKNSFNELIERDLFLRQFYLGIPFSKLDVKAPENVLNFLRQSNDRIEFYQTNITEFGFTLIGVIKGERFGAMISTDLVSKPNDFSASINKIIINLLRNYRAYLNNNMDSISLEKFNKLDACDFTDHYKLALNIDYFQRIQFLFPEQKFETNQNDLNFYDDKEISSIKLNVPEEFIGCGLHFYKHQCNSILELVAGQPKFEEISNTLNITKASIVNKLPHPLS